VTGAPRPARSDAPDEPVIRIRALTKHYKVGDEEVRALDGVDLDIRPNEFVAIMGASGSGKSTLMNILGCLDKPTSGEYILNSKPTHRLGMGHLARVRNEEIGFIFQSFELLSRASALRNVMLPMLYSRRHLFSARKRAKNALERVSLANRADHRPNQLSGGQRQRVAVARALVNDPAILLADEPTGNLDSKTTVEIINLFTQLHESGQTIVVVTHEEDVAGKAQRIVRLRDGRIISDHPTDEDPVHRDWLTHMASGAAARDPDDLHPKESAAPDQAPDQAPDRTANHEPDREPEPGQQPDQPEPAAAHQRETP